PGAIKIGLNNGVPSLDRIVDSGLWKLAPGIVHHDVEPAEPVPTGVDEVINLLRIADGHRNRQDLGTEFLDKHPRALKLFRIASAYHQSSAEARGQAGRRLAETTSASRHQYGPCPKTGLLECGRKRPQRVIVIAPGAVQVFGHRAN